MGPARVLRRGGAHAEIAKLKQRLGKDLLTFGSHYVWNGLLHAGLVDELHIMLGPSLVAGGTPAFEHATASRLTLLEARRLPDS